jgi:hypothetical protein
MAISNKLIKKPGSVTQFNEPDIFTCPGNAEDFQEHAVTCIVFCNYTGDSVNPAISSTLTVYAIQNGDAQSEKHTIIKELLIPAGETFTFDTEKLVLSSGDIIRAFASEDNAIACTVSSMRVS